MRALTRCAVCGADLGSFEGLREHRLREHDQRYCRSHLRWFVDRCSECVPPRVSGSGPPPRSVVPRHLTDRRARYGIDVRRTRVFEVE